MEETLAWMCCVMDTLGSLVKESLWSLVIESLWSLEGFTWEKMGCRGWCTASCLSSLWPGLTLKDSARGLNSVLVPTSNKRPDCVLLMLMLL